MSTDTNEIALTGDANDHAVVMNEKLTPTGVVLVAMAAVGTYVVTKKVNKIVQERMAVRREMKRLYKQSKKSA